MSPDLALPTREAVSGYREALVPWFREHARDLPWRRDPTPYRIWVSEVMLQQTRVGAVLPYYERFLRRFPSLTALGAASEEEVLEAWSGLGYYRRARMLLAGAREVRRRHGGEFPTDLAAAVALPGIGRYTAGAILSIACAVRAPILDGNVTRVLTRGFGIHGDVSRAAVSRALWALAERVVAEGEPGEVNQAQMELGALVCKPAAPDCAACPLEPACVASRDGLTERLPQLPKRRATVALTRSVLLVRRGEEVLLRQRRADELLPGLWDLPGAFTGANGDRSGGVDEAVELLPFDVEVGPVVGRLKHAITHRRIELEVREASEVGPGDRTTRLTGADGASLLWCARNEGMKKALSSPARRILRRWGPA